MFSDFRKVFNPTQNEREKTKKYLRKIYDPNKKDCELCVHFIKSDFTFVEGGFCNLTKKNCGHGFYCSCYKEDRKSKKKYETSINYKKEI